MLFMSAFVCVLSFLVFLPASTKKTVDLSAYFKCYAVFCCYRWFSAVIVVGFLGIA